jgi:hypothetical protein
LIGTENECAVSPVISRQNDRPPETTTKLVLNQLRPPPGRKEVAGVQIVVPQKLEKTAMELVSSRLAHCQEDAAGRAPVFGAHGVGEYPEFLECVRVREIRASVVHVRQH